jgi:oligosaccharide repeat unit polymerase
MGGPLFCIIVFINITAQWTGFIVINSKAINILILGLCCFWLGGMFIISILRVKKKKNLETSYIVTEKIPYYFINVSCVVFVVIMLLNLNTTLNNRSLSMIENHEFAITGVVGHIAGLIMGYLIFYIVSFWDIKVINKYLAFLFVVIIFFLKMLSGVRGNIILPLFSAVIYLLIKKHIRITPQISLISIGIVFLLFIVPTFFFGKIADFDYVLPYFLFYFCAGVLGLSAYLDQPFVPWAINPDFIYIFFINFYKKLLGQGDYVSALNEDFVTSTTSHATYTFRSNVYTLIGEVYVNCGYFTASIYLFLLGAYAYFLFSKIEKGIMMLLLYSFVGAALAMGFFSQYILMPYFYEIQLLFIVLHLFSKLNYHKKR